ncbi:hypothetical protein FRC01_013610 [Tulasnella sp. 417]|nr:hypothetical protein FRC01_013610 [Tulasnella sp. 417]
MPSKPSSRRITERDSIIEFMDYHTITSVAHFGHLTVAKVLREIADQAPVVGTQMVAQVNGNAQLIPVIYEGYVITHQG